MIVLGSYHLARRMQGMDKTTFQGGHRETTPPPVQSRDTPVKIRKCASLPT